MRLHMHGETGVEGTASWPMAVLTLPLARHVCCVTLSLEAELRCSRQCLLKIVQVRQHRLLAFRVRRSAITACCPINTALVCLNANNIIRPVSPYLSCSTLQFHTDLARLVVSQVQCHLRPGFFDLRCHTKLGAGDRSFSNVTPLLAEKQG